MQGRHTSIKRLAIAATLLLSAGSLPSLAQQAPAGTATQPTANDASLSERTQNALQVCFTCHGQGGVSLTPSRPTIAGQNAEYMRRQLLAFKRAAAGKDAGVVVGDAGARSDPVMGHMAESLANDLVVPVANALSYMPCSTDQDKMTKLSPIQMPEVTYSCVGCHGENGIATQGHIPNLAGQQRTYLRRELLLIRETAWGAKPREGEAYRSHPIMEAQGARLRIADIDAIARYYSALDCGGGTQQELGKK